MGFDGVIICTIAMMGSFGPVVALSSLSNNLNQTLASGERVLSVLEEKPQVEEIYEEKTMFRCAKKNRRSVQSRIRTKYISGCRGVSCDFFL